MADSPPTARVALALGSGGARGYAHIGVIHELRERGYEVVGVAGSSMGALVGGLHAAGSLDEFADWAKTLTQRAVLRLLDPSITAAGVLRAEKILDAVRDMLGDATIESLPIPYTAVATDLIAGKSVWLQRGPVDAAIRASIAIPGIIAPHVLDGRLLADGGILDPLPMAPIAAVNADLTIAVSLGGAGSDAVQDQSDGPETRATTEWLTGCCAARPPCWRPRLPSRCEAGSAPPRSPARRRTTPTRTAPTSWWTARARPRSPSSAASR